MFGLSEFDVQRCFEPRYSETGFLMLGIHKDQDALA